MTCRKRISCHVLLYTRMDETAPIDSAALFGSSFWVDDVKTGGLPLLRDQLGGCTETAQAASGMEAARSSIWLGRNSLAQAMPQRRQSWPSSPLSSPPSTTCSKMGRCTCRQTGRTLGLLNGGVGIATRLFFAIFFAIFLRLPPNEFLRIPPDLSPVSIQLALLFLLLTRLRIRHPIAEHLRQ